MKFRHDLPFGANLRPDGSTRFRIWAPSAERLDLVIDGTRRGMEHEGGGWHALTVAVGAGTRYQFVMPDGTRFADPASRMQDRDIHDPSVVVDPQDYEWQNTEWRGRPWHETVLYEAHPGLMGGYRGIQDRLPELQRLGITAIELMPIADFPGRHNWGYDGVLLFAPDRAYGTPDDLKAMIDAAHGLGIGIHLDVVYNHFGPDGAYIHDFARSFFREDVHSAWGAAIDFRRPEVRDFFIQNALYWLNEYRFDGLRLDAVAAIGDYDYLLEFARIVHGQVERGRHVALVIENEYNMVSLLGAPPRFDAQWNDDFHHVLHVLLTGEDDGYYAGFKDTANQLCRVLSEGFAYQGEVPPFKDKPRGEPSAGTPPTCFVNFLQNHDQTGNRAFGERLSALVGPQALRAATALLLLTPCVPMLFMGDEWASRSPFLFFTDHHDALADLVREGRRSEFAHFSGFGDANRERIPDPNAPSTFAASAPERTDTAHYDWLRRVLTLRRERLMPHLPGTVSEAAAPIGPSAVRATWRLGNGQQLRVAINLGAESVDPQIPDGPPLFTEGDWQEGALGPAAFVAHLSA